MQWLSAHAPQKQAAWRDAVMRPAFAWLMASALLASSVACAGSIAFADSINCDRAAPQDVCERKNSVKQVRQNAEDAKQRALVAAAAARLAPQRKGITDLYTIGAAAWADEDVFVKELDGTIASLAKVLPIDGRVLRLVNGDDPHGPAPLATRANIAAAVRAVGDRMDKDEDVLILFMTSHGSRSGVGLQRPRRPLTELMPRDLAAMLEGAGIRHRVVIVSACYSGTFVPPLANDNTIVITAADARNPSFGCAPGRDWTYFGDAFFNRSLHPGVDLERAFNDARIVISAWELADRLSSSNPQAHFGPALVEKLAPLFAAKASAGQP
jgi:hypothetical protein